MHESLAYQAEQSRFHHKVRAIAQEKTNLDQYRSSCERHCFTIFRLDSSKCQPPQILNSPTSLNHVLMLFETRGLRWEMKMVRLLSKVVHSNLNCNSPRKSCGRFRTIFFKLDLQLVGSPDHSDQVVFDHPDIRIDVYISRIAISVRSSGWKNFEQQRFTTVKNLSAAKTSNCQNVIMRRLFLSKLSRLHQILFPRLFYTYTIQKTTKISHHLGPVHYCKQIWQFFPKNLLLVVLGSGDPQDWFAEACLI